MKLGLELNNSIVLVAETDAEVYQLEACKKFAETNNIRHHEFRQWDIKSLTLYLEKVVL